MSIKGDKLMLKTLLAERMEHIRHIENQRKEINRMAVDIADLKRVITMIAAKRNERYNFTQRCLAAIDEIINCAEDSAQLHDAIQKAMVVVAPSLEGRQRKGSE